MARDKYEVLKGMDEAADAALPAVVKMIQEMSDEEFQGACKLLDAITDNRATVGYKRMYGLIVRAIQLRKQAKPLKD